MRTIKFRGKDNKGKWLYGQLLHWNGAEDDPWIQTDVKGQFSVMKAIGGSVVPETVGQFTGLFDRNSKEIYEGDICSLEHPNGFVYMFVEWDKAHFGFRIKGENHVGCADAFECWIAEKRVRVIGNIHDDPNMFGDKKED